MPKLVWGVISMNFQHIYYRQERGAERAHPDCGRGSAKPAGVCASALRSVRKGKAFPFTLFVSFLFLFCLPGQGAAALRVLESGQGDRFQGASLENLRMVNDNDGTEALRLADNEAVMDAFVDLLLRGNSREEMSSLFYNINAENVIIDTVLPLSGTGSMRFVQPEHRIVLVPRSGALLAESEDMGSFSFDFWIYPNARYDEEEIFSRSGSVVDENGRYVDTGIRIFFRNNRVTLSFRNIFRDARGEYRNTVTISGETMCALRQWQHVAFSYDSKTGKLSRVVDGIEDAVVWVCDTGRFGGSPLRAAFPAGFRRDAQIGGGFRGSLDSFRVRRAVWDNANLGRYSETPGRVVSRVIDMGTENARFAALSWDADTPSGSAVFFEYRISDSIFPANHPSILWIRARNRSEFLEGALGNPPNGLLLAQRSEQLGETPARGRYVQWRATLVGSERGRVTPLLRSVRLAWDTSYTPQTPVDLRAAPGDRRVLLSWRGNLDKISGYRIYIGSERGEYMHPDSPIDVPLELVNSRAPEYVLYNLENDRLYYFNVLAYTADGMLSEFAGEVYARPGLLERLPR